MIKFIRKMFEMFFLKRTNQSVVVTEELHVNTAKVENPSKPLRILTEEELEERKKNWAKKETDLLIRESDVRYREKLVNIDRKSTRLNSSH